MPIEQEDPDARAVFRPRRKRRSDGSPHYAIPVFVIEDNRLLRDGIVARLNAQPDVRVVAAVDGANIALNRLRETAPRVVLVDAGLGDEDVYRLLERVRAAVPDARIIIMDLLPAQDDIAGFVKAGASGFIMKNSTPDALIDAVRSVAAGENVLPFELTGTLLTHIANHALARRPGPQVVRAVRMTKREREVVDLIAEGLSNGEIGRRLHIGTHTVKSHVHNILDKLALRTRLQVASYERSESDRHETVRRPE